MDMNSRFKIKTYHLLSMLLSMILLMFISGCVTFAPPSPLMTFGGPETTPHKASEVALGFGTGVALFDKKHAGAQGWLGRYKYGLSEKFDLGIDMVGAKRNEGLYLSAKLASRYQLTKKSRLEIGLGVADDSDGKSINGDFAYTIGTIKNKNWNYYSSLRYGFAKGVAGNAVTLPGQTQLNDSIPPPNTSFLLINLGAQGNITKTQKFIIEGGYGYIFPDGEKNGPAFFISAGLLFFIGSEE